MNDRPHPVSDEDVSAVVDGLADDHTVARVRADAADRLEAMEAARHLLATTPLEPLDARAVDDLVAGALAATEGDPEDADPAQDDPATDGSGAVAGVPRPGPPSRPSRSRVPVWLVAAAVLAMMAVGIGLIRAGRTDDTAAKFDTVGSSINASGGAEERSPEPGSPTADRAADASTTAAAGAVATAPVPVVDLGAYADPDELRTALRTGFGTGTTTRSLPGLAVDRCRTQAEVTLSLTGTPTHTGLATVAGRDVLVYVYPYEAADHPEVTELVVARGRDACDPVLTFQR